ncbi:MAG: hypothetical protein JNN29_04940 [Chitinophagaceae bacterium]|nr:hypothetical protein [Chitinophagaceae bacterium]
MRKKSSDGPLTVQAIAGSYVVMFGINMPKNKTQKLLGFAIQRKDIQENEVTWMRGMKAFIDTNPMDGLGANYSSREHPFQSFQWADYSVKPGRQYTYKIIAMRGSPTQLTESETVSMSITTEDEQDGKHAIFFNRGAAASQEYARRFQNKRPDEVGEAAFNWLSRGLVESIRDFLEQAKDGTFSIAAALYEFNYADVLEYLKEAKQRGAKVKVVYHAAEDETKAHSEEAIDEANIKSICEERANTLNLQHNKFFVLLKNEKPVQVLTGSTNISLNGIFGHSNLAHIVRDTKVAEAYYEYWKQLKADKSGAEMKDWADEVNTAPPEGDEHPDIFPVFSPHRGLDVLKWYAELADSATEGLFMTFPFGINKEFISVYEKEDKVLRMALLDKKGNNDTAKANVDRVRRLVNCVVAVGNNIRINSFDRWLKEMRSIISSPRVPYIHTKYMLVDPLGPHPIVVTGSANFSDNSTHTNDENMLVIRNDKRVADIYLGEFMRLYSHYAFRESLTFKPNNTVDRSALIPDSSWVNDYYGKSSRSMRRQYFSGEKDA